MAILPFARRKLLLWGGATTGIVGGGLWLWPSSEQQAAYPFARRVAGKREALWSVPPERLLQATEQDGQRLGLLLAGLDTAVKQL
ncbi:MAG TPA: hypothetical protein VIW29_14600, partial [Polyangiaceae bacterium]